MKSIWKTIAVPMLLVCAGCASTQLTETWRNPGVPPLTFQKVLVMAVEKSPTLRRIAEDEMVRALQPTQAVPSYRILSEAEIQNPVQALAHLTQNGFDGAVIMSVVSDNTRVTYVPGTYVPDMLDYWGEVWPPLYQPGYYIHDRVVRVETNVYALPSRQLVWSGISQTLNPSNFGSLAEGIAKEVHARLRKQGMLA